MDSTIRKYLVKVAEGLRTIKLKIQDRNSSNMAGMRFFRQLSEFRLKGDWEKDSFCHVHAVFEAQL